ncbi:MAG: hypothetical protein Q7K54_01395 [Candidatus Parcubacteria bacterium]|nr:hypothetical protein [Candidatus Parcubacteria bacterium]
MKRGIIFSLLIFFLLLANTNTVFAFSSFRFLLPQFSGRIVFSPAIEIASLQMMSFQCAVMGSTFSIYPIGSPAGTPVSYFVPFGVFSKTRNAIRIGQLIIGKYSFKTPIVCTSSTTPPVITTVLLDTVTMFGNSR